MTPRLAFFFGWSSFRVVVFDLIKESEVSALLAALDVHDRPVYAGLVTQAGAPNFSQGDMTFRCQLRNLSELT